MWVVTSPSASSHYLQKVRLFIASLLEYVLYVCIGPSGGDVNEVVIAVSVVGVIGVIVIVLLFILILLNCQRRKTYYSNNDHSACKYCLH